MLRILTALIFYVVTSITVSAQSTVPADVLFRALGFPEIIKIMRQEGVEYGASMEQDLFLREGGPRWQAIVSDIYDVDWMSEIVRNRLAGDLATADLAPMIDFFTSDLGQRIVRLEISARAAFLEDGVEAAANETYLALQTDAKARVRLLDAFVDASDLVESNVVGAMNSNYAFYTGLADGGGFDGALTQDQILTDVWSEEDAIRTDTRLWVYSYLALAYQPLSDDDLRAYTAYFETSGGRALNQAIFNSFDEMFVAISTRLGRGAAQFLAGEDL